MEDNPVEFRPSPNPVTPARRDESGAPSQETSEGDVALRRFYTASLLTFFSTLRPGPRPLPNQNE
jgi:hypothetical protein